MKTRTIIEYILAATVVLILGAFTGWYFFINTQTQATIANDVARGYSQAPSGGGSGGSAITEAAPGPQTFTSNDSSRSGKGALSRLWGAITGRGTGISDPNAPSFEQGVGEFGYGGDSQAGELAPKLAAKSPPRLWHVEKRPVAGMAFVKNGSSERLRYVERATGYIFEADPVTGTTVRLTNTLIPRVYEALVTEKGGVVGRSLDEAGNTTAFVGFIATSTDDLNATSSARALITADLPKRIARISVNPKTDALFYLTSDGSGVAGIRSEWNGTKSARIFTSSIVHWHPWWLSDGRMILVQAATDSVPGFAYALKDGVLEPILRAIPGLTLLPREGGALLYGQSSNGVLTMFTRISANTTAIPLSIKTIADKCVWATGKEFVAYCGVPRGLVPQNFLDGWYRGALHSSDALWRVDANAGNAEMLYTPEAGNPLDVTRPTTDSAGYYIALINASDQSLWLLRIKN